MVSREKPKVQYVSGPRPIPALAGSDTPALGLPSIHSSGYGFQFDRKRTARRSAASALPQHPGYRGNMQVKGISVSIIIPVVNEGSQLTASLQRLFQNLPDDAAIEVIISDGGSTDDTIEIAKQFPCRVVSGKKGRAAQMNSASRKAKGKQLLFLHADSELPEQWFSEVSSSGDWGFFPVKLDGRHWLLRIIESAMNFRSRYSQVATGDQGLFFQKSFYDELQGYPEILIMEDIAISKLSRRRSRPFIASKPMITSSRRWEKNGIIKTVLLMWGIRFAYWVGINPDRLHRYYYPHLYH